eukprot:7429886-Lingulodinium_polyedra.AAC.1
MGTSSWTGGLSITVDSGVLARAPPTRGSASRSCCSAACTGDGRRCPSCQSGLECATLAASTASAWP